jgi:biopolymer transport protein ExbD
MRFMTLHTYSCHPDMTPMLDLTFQLTFFFMLALNFSTDIQSDLIRLPASEIAKPSESALETPISVQLLASGLVLFNGDQMAAGALRGALQREHNVLTSSFGKQKVSSATIVIRADHEVSFGKVQEVIRICQDTGFEKFALRSRAKTQ